MMRVDTDDAPLHRVVTRLESGDFHRQRERGGVDLGGPVVSGLPSVSSTSSLANSFSMGASNLIETSDGGVENCCPAEGVSCSGNECAAATGTPVRLAAKDNSAPNINNLTVFIRGTPD